MPPPISKCPHAKYVVVVVSFAFLASTAAETVEVLEYRYRFNEPLGKEGIREVWRLQLLQQKGSENL